MTAEKLCRAAGADWSCDRPAQKGRTLCSGHRAQNPPFEPLRSWERRTPEVRAHREDDRRADLAAARDERERASWPAKSAKLESGRERYLRSGWRRSHGGAQHPQKLGGEPTVPVPDMEGLQRSTRGGSASGGLAEVAGKKPTHSNPIVSEPEEPEPPDPDELAEVRERLHQPDLPPAGKWLSLSEWCQIRFDEAAHARLDGLSRSIRQRPLSEPLEDDYR